MTSPPARVGRRVTALAAAFEGTLFLVALGTGHLAGYPPLANVRTTGAAAAGGALATLPLLAAMAWGLRTTWGPIARLRNEIHHSVTPLFARCTLTDFVVISGLAGLGEEALFRGVLQPALSAALGPSAGLLLTSAAFGLAHFISPAYAVAAGVMGLYLGVLAMATGNLLVPVIAHALYDFVALIALARRRDAPPTNRPGS